VANAPAGTSAGLAGIQVDWAIETAGKRGFRRAAARARADAAWLAVPSEAWRLRGALAEAFIRSRFADERVDVARNIARRQEELARLLDARVRVGAVDRNTAALQRLAWIAAQSDVARFEREALGERARVAAELAIPARSLAAAEWKPLPDLDGPDLGELETADGRRAALLGRADLLALLAEYAAAEAELRFELARQVPDLRLGPAYEFDQGASKWGLTLSLDLPLLNQNQGAIAEAIARRDEVAARFEALQDRVISEVDAALAALRGARREAEVARRLVAAARERGGRVRRAFLAGAADRLALLQAGLEVGRSVAARIDAEEQVRLAAAQLELAVQPPRPFIQAVVEWPEWQIREARTP